MAVLQKMTTWMVRTGIQWTLTWQTWVQWHLMEKRQQERVIAISRRSILTWACSNRRRSPPLTGAPIVLIFEFKRFFYNFNMALLEKCKTMKSDNIRGIPSGNEKMPWLALFCHPKYCWISLHLFFLYEISVHKIFTMNPSPTQNKVHQNAYTAWFTIF